MTTAEYAQKVIDIIDARPPGIDLDKRLCKIYVEQVLQKPSATKETAFLF